MILPQSVTCIDALPTPGPASTGQERKFPRRTPSCDSQEAPRRILTCRQLVKLLTVCLLLHDPPVRLMARLCGTAHVLTFVPSPCLADRLHPCTLNPTIQHVYVPEPPGKDRSWYTAVLFSKHIRSLVSTWWSTDLGSAIETPRFLLVHGRPVHDQNLFATDFNSLIYFCGRL